MTDHTIVLSDHDKSRADLVAEAIALCDVEISRAREEVRYQGSLMGLGVQEAHRHFQNQLNSWLTHKAEFEEHKGAHSEVGYVCQKCTKSFSQDGMTIRQYPCDFITTKAKRLLGRE